MDVIDEIFMDMKIDMNKHDDTSKAIKRARKRTKALFKTKDKELEATRDQADKEWKKHNELIEGEGEPSELKIRLGEQISTKPSRFDDRPPNDVKTSKGELKTNRWIL